MPCFVVSHLGIFHFDGIDESGMDKSSHPRTCYSCKVRALEKKSRSRDWHGLRPFANSACTICQHARLCHFPQSNFELKKKKVNKINFRRVPMKSGARRCMLYTMCVMLSPVEKYNGLFQAKKKARATWIYTQETENF